MALIDDVKDILRVSGTDFDSEIENLILSARMELQLAGVTSELAQGDDDELIKRAIFTYCKAEFGWDNQEADRLRKSFDLIKQHLTLSADYV